MTKKGQTPEHRAKISASIKAKWQDPEYRAMLSAAAAASWQNPETRARRIAAMTGKPKSAEHRAAVAASWQNPETRARRIAAMTGNINASLPVEEDARIYDMFVSGVSRAEIARTTGHTMKTVMSAIARVGAVDA